MKILIFRITFPYLLLLHFALEKKGDWEKGGGLTPALHCLNAFFYFTFFSHAVAHWSKV